MRGLPNVTDAGKAAHVRRQRVGVAWGSRRWSWLRPRSSCWLLLLSLSGSRSSRRSPGASGWSGSRKRPWVRLTPPIIAIERPRRREEHSRSKFTRGEAAGARRARDSVRGLSQSPRDGQLPDCHHQHRGDDGKWLRCEFRVGAVVAGTPPFCRTSRSIHQSRRRRKQGRDGRHRRSLCGFRERRNRPNSQSRQTSTNCNPFSRASTIPRKPGCFRTSSPGLPNIGNWTAVFSTSPSRTPTSRPSGSPSAPVRKQQTPSGMPWRPSRP